MANFQSHFDLAVSAFHMGNYEEAYARFVSITEDFGQDPTVYFYMASSNIGRIVVNPLNYFSSYEGIIIVAFENYRRCFQLLAEDPERLNHFDTYVNQTIQALENAVIIMDNIIAHEQRAIKQTKNSSTWDFVIAALFTIFGKTRTNYYDRAAAFNAIGNGAEKRQIAGRASELLNVAIIMRNNLAHYAQQFVDLFAEVLTPEEMASIRKRLT